MTMAGRRCIGLQVKNEKSNIFNFLILFFFSLVQGHILVATVLLKNGANVTAETNDGETPLSLAKKYDHARMAELLKANGAN